MKLKRAIYYLISIIIGIFLSFIAHALIEIWYLNQLEKGGCRVIWYTHWGYGACALPPYLQYFIFALGVLVGLLLGIWGFRVVYEEKRGGLFKRK